MATVTIKINEKSQAGKTFLEMVKFFHSKKNVIEIVEEKSPYNPKFVKMIKESAKEKGGKVLKTRNVWESIK
jgi:hypothetical protein